jgi:mercuric reductase
MLLEPRAGAIRDTDEVLGVSMVGNSAGEVIHEAAMAMRFHARIDDFIDLLHVYPTMAEALKSSPFPAAKTPKSLVVSFSVFGRHNVIRCSGPRT